MKILLEFILLIVSIFFTALYVIDIFQSETQSVLPWIGLTLTVYVMYSILTSIVKEENNNE